MVLFRFNLVRTCRFVMVISEMGCKDTDFFHLSKFFRNFFSNIFLNFAVGPSGTGG